MDKKWIPPSYKCNDCDNIFSHDNTKLPGAGTNSSFHPMCTKCNSKNVIQLSGWKFE
jgi:DNA-directed RNA polymerase subunit RPC12/RpoP